MDWKLTTDVLLNFGSLSSETHTQETKIHGLGLQRIQSILRKIIRSESTGFGLRVEKHLKITLQHPVAYVSLFPPSTAQAGNLRDISFGNIGTWAQ
jgi:hypothetical protein